MSRWPSRSWDATRRNQPPLRPLASQALAPGVSAPLLNKLLRQLRLLNPVRHQNACSRSSSRSKRPTPSAKPLTNTATCPKPNRISTMPSISCSPAASTSSPTPELQEEFDRIVDQINGLEMEALKQGNGFTPKDRRSPPPKPPPTSPSSSIPTLWPRPVPTSPPPSPTFPLWSTTTSPPSSTSSPTPQRATTPCFTPSSAPAAIAP